MSCVGNKSVCGLPANSAFAAATACDSSASCLCWSTWGAGWSPETISASSAATCAATWSSSSLFLNCCADNVSPSGVVTKSGLSGWSTTIGIFLSASAFFLACSSKIIDASVIASSTTASGTPGTAPAG